ncbi:MAG TPA: DUF4388 domain-containing protein [Verrucomicrobiae bacterium]
MLTRFLCVALALHFLNGENKGAEFPVPDGGALLLNLTSDHDITLDIMANAQRFAVVTGWGDRAAIRSLNSGEFVQVNQEEVAQAELKEGDRLRLGKILVVVVVITRFSMSAQKPSGETEIHFVSKVRTRGQEERTTGLSGTIAETPVPDLLQFLCRYGRTGVVRIENLPVVARIHMRDGHVCFASIDASPLPPLRALFRIFRWTKGTFVFEQGPVNPQPDEIEMSTENAILEGLRMMDETKDMEAELPSWSSRLRVSGDLTGAQAGLPPQEMQALLLVMELGIVGRVIDQMPDDDTAIAALTALLRKGFVVAEE